MNTTQSTINRIIQNALNEDRVNHDVTSQSLIPASSVSTAYIVLKEDATLCGIDVAKKVFTLLSPRINFRKLANDGDQIKKGTQVAAIKGNSRKILAGERVALNFLGHLSGIATQTKKYVQATKPYKAKILDTRKTTPGLRILEKYAVRCGGGVNHRMSLEDMVLIKDNHREALSSNDALKDAIKKIRKKKRISIEIEVDNLIQFKEALKTQPEYILCDNMNTTQLKKARTLVKNLKKRPLLEASGGVTLQRVKNLARTGVDRISVGALTHSVQAINFSMEFVTS